MRRVRERLRLAGVFRGPETPSGEEQSPGADGGDGRHEPIEIYSINIII